MNKVILALLLLPPAIGELVSGSSPPLLFFNPFTISILVLLYGCGTLLIREAKARWKLQWSIIFLAMAYGIIEEGITVKSFFNPRWVDMGVLSGYAMYFGVQWVWTIGLIAYHATISTLVPIVIIDELWPEYKDIPMLGKKGIILAFSGLGLVMIGGMAFLGTMENNKMVPYFPGPFLLPAAFLTVFLLIWLAYRFRNSRISTSAPFVLMPFLFGLSGFLFQLINLTLPGGLAKANVPALVTLIVQSAIIILALLFIIFQVYHKNATQRHIIALTSGSLLFWILLAPFHEFLKGLNNDPTQGMIIVGIAGFISLLAWRKAVLKKIKGYNVNGALGGRPRRYRPDA